MVCCIPIVWWVQTRTQQWSTVWGSWAGVSLNTGIACIHVAYWFKNNILLDLVQLRHRLPACLLHYRLVVKYFFVSTNKKNMILSMSTPILQMCCSRVLSHEYKKMYLYWSHQVSIIGSQLINPLMYGAFAIELSDVSKPFKFTRLKGFDKVKKLSDKRNLWKVLKGETTLWTNIPLS